MNLIHQINGFLAKSIGLLNAVLAVLLVLFGAALGSGVIGGLVGILVGLLVGVAMAVGACGLLAVLINIRDLLAESLDQRRRLDEPRAKSED